MEMVQDLLYKLDDVRKAALEKLLSIYQAAQEKCQRLVEFFRAMFVDKAIERAKEIFEAFEPEDKTRICTSLGHRLSIVKGADGKLCLCHHLFPA